MHQRRHTCPGPPARLPAAPRTPRADLKASNARGSGAALNKGVQSFLFGVLSGGSEAAAKRSLGVLGELWRRHVWRDARTVNVIGEAAASRPAGLGWRLAAWL